MENFKTRRTRWKKNWKEEGYRPTSLKVVRTWIGECVDFSWLTSQVIETDCVTQGWDHTLLRSIYIGRIRLTRRKSNYYRVIPNVPRELPVRKTRDVRRLRRNDFERIHLDLFFFFFFQSTSKARCVIIFNFSFNFSSPLNLNKQI